MADIFVYAPNCEDFDNLGECGPLTCTSAKFSEEANGMSELTLEHPIDDIGRWSYLKDSYILMAEVPVRTTPEIVNGAIVTSTERWRVKSTATKGERGVYSKKSGGKRLRTLDVWVKVVDPITGVKSTIQNTVTVVDLTGSRYKIKYKKGYGYVSVDAIERDVINDPLAPTPESIEFVEPAWSVKPQFFRIYSSEVSDDGVVVKARHICYDLLGNLVSYTVDNPSCVSALGSSYWNEDGTRNSTPGILNSCIKPHDFVGRSNVADLRVIADWTRVSPIEALLNPETGLTTLWGVDLVRDNWELTVLNDAGLNRGVRIEYGKNLVGVKCSVDTSDLITSIYPIGQTSKGKPLYLVAGTYTVDGKTITIDDSLTVKSSHEAEYSVPHVFVLDLGSAAKAAGTSGGAVLDAREKMIKACLDKFEDEECDLPLLDLTVEFIALGDTEEGKQYKELENLYLFDRVTVYHPKIGIDILTSVVRVEFNPLTERFLSVELGPVRKYSYQKKTPAWKLPPVQKIAYGAVQSGELADFAVNDTHLAEASVTTPALAEKAVTTQVIADNAVTTQIIADGAVSDIKISGVGGDKISGTISGLVVDVTNLNANNITQGTLQGERIAVGAITADHIINGAITGDKIPYGSIVASKLDVTQHLIY